MVPGERSCCPWLQPRLRVAMGTQQHRGDSGGRLGSRAAGRSPQIKCEWDFGWRLLRSDSTSRLLQRKLFHCSVIWLQPSLIWMKPCSALWDTCVAPCMTEDSHLWVGGCAAKSKLDGEYVTRPDPISVRPAAAGGRWCKTQPCVNGTEATLLRRMPDQ